MSYVVNCSIYEVAKNELRSELLQNKKKVKEYNMKSIYKYII